MGTLSPPLHHPINGTIFPLCSLNFEEFHAKRTSLSMQTYTLGFAVRLVFHPLLWTLYH